MTKLRLGVLSVVLGSGCMASGIQLTKQRAAFDFPCEQAKIDVQMLSGISERGTGSVFGASGCGKKATYIRGQQTGMVLNSPIQETN
jgi:hypothetical protein